MARSDFNENKDINRYLAQQGRAPQSHLDWDTWRKVGQPGTYQAPPGSASRFQPTRAGVGAPNYDSPKSHWNMYDGSVGQAIGNLAVKGIQKLAGRRGKDNDSDKIDSGSSGGSASSGNGTDMADDGSMGGADRSQRASITPPATSRGMRRSRRGDFGQVTQQYGIQMVQGNDNYGTVYGNMGGANVGGGSYDNSFQSKNTGGNQTAFSGNNNAGPVNINSGGPFGGGPDTPQGPNTPPPVGPSGPTGITMVDPPMPPRPPIKVGGPNNPGQPPALPPGPQRPALPVGQDNGQGPSTYGNTPGVEGAQETKDIARQDKVTELATGGATEGERDAAGNILNKSGIQSNVNPANQRGAGDTAPPMLAGYENMKEVAPQQNTRFGDMGMGVPANSGRPGMPPQFDRMRGTVPAQYQSPDKTYAPGADTGVTAPGINGRYPAGAQVPPMMQGMDVANSQAWPTEVGQKQGAYPGDPDAERAAARQAGKPSPAPAVAAPAAKKAGGGRKAAAPKAKTETVEGPKNPAAKKAAGPAKKAAGSKATAKPKEKK